MLIQYGKLRVFTRSAAAPRVRHGEQMKAVCSMNIEKLRATRARCLVQLNSFCILSATRIPTSFAALPGACQSRRYLRQAANGPHDSMRHLQMTWDGAREFKMVPPQPQHSMEMAQFNQWLAGHR